MMDKSGIIEIDEVVYHYFWYEVGRSKPRSGLTGFTKHWPEDVVSFFTTKAKVITSTLNPVPGYKPHETVLPDKLTKRQLGPGDPSPIFGTPCIDSDGREYAVRIAELDLDEIVQLKAAGVWPEDTTNQQEIEKERLRYNTVTGSLAWDQLDGETIEYVLSEYERMVFNRLYECHQRREGALHTHHLLQGTESDCMKDVFKRTPIYNTLIVKGSQKGTWKIKP